MLAHFAKPVVALGMFEDGLHAPNAFRHRLIALIAYNLPRWRDDPGRPRALAETELTEQLCRFLQRVAHQGDGWDCVQFVHESRDDLQPGRRLDIGVAPSEKQIVIEEKCYNCYDTIMYIECKRLPTPTGSDRDEREYIFSVHGNERGGIQRFKTGAHCAGHSIVLMIGYVQEDSPRDWHPRLCVWIDQLVANGVAGWSDRDALQIEIDDPEKRIMQLRSQHERVGKLPPLELWHLWVGMN